MEFAIAYAGDGEYMRVPDNRKALVWEGPDLGAKQCGKVPSGVSDSPGRIATMLTAPARAGQADVPGCASTGATWAQIRDNIREALCFHVEGVVESGQAPPEPLMSVEEAMAYHSQPREEVVETSEPAADLPTTVEIVEIEVVLPQPVMSLQ